MSRAQLTSTVEQNTGGAVSPYVAGKNKIINGDFGVWQRGTSVAIAAGTRVYAPDRWWFYQSTGTATVSQQSPGITGVRYSARYQRNAGQTATAAMYMQQSIETSMAIPCAGKTMTISFYAKCGANYSSGSNSLSIQIAQGTGTDESGFGGYTGNSFALSTSVTLTTSFQFFTVTFSLSSAATEFQPLFIYYPTGTAGANDWFEIANIQIEAGSVATAFTTATGTLSGELGACQRYYWQTAWNTSGATTIMVSGIGIGSTQVAQAYCAHPVTMRAIPSAALNGTSNMVFYNGAGGGTTFAISAIASQNSSTIAGTLSITTSGTTANVVYNLLALTAGNGYISFSAEL